MNIIINGSVKQTDEATLTFEQLALLADPDDPGFYNTITYSHGLNGASGSLVAGGELAIVEGMIFRALNLEDQ